MRDHVGHNWSGGVGPKIDDINDENGRGFGSVLKNAAGEDVGKSYMAMILWMCIGC